MKINMTTQLKDTLNILSSEYAFEIAGYLVGEIKDGEISVDGILIPSQNFSVASVEITPEHQVALLKKYGKDKCKRIIGHWHSHHNMGVFWSGQDYVNMKNIMCYEKLFVFIVSSKETHLIKICMREPLKLDFDEVDIYMKTKYLDHVRKRIDKLRNDSLDTVKSEDKVEEEVEE